MKIKKAPKGLAHIRDRAITRRIVTEAPLRQFRNEHAITSEKDALSLLDELEARRALEQHLRATETPAEAHLRGVGYSGKEMPDKGQKDGSCNRTACQLPLTGQQQWTISTYGGKGGTDGLYYYCSDCAAKFHQADRDMGRPLRCAKVVA